MYGQMLNGRFPKGSIDEPTMDVIHKLTEGTIALWRTMQNKMLPTPAKFHYIFNLRDLSRVFQGVFMCPVREVIHSDTVLLGLWKHECERVFSDRLIEQKDTDWFHSQICEQLAETFKKDWKAVTNTEEERLLYGDFMKDEGAEYEVMPDMKALIEKNMSRTIGR